MSERDWEEDALELAHALYTVWMHAQQPREGLIAGRIRGAMERVPWLADAYPQFGVLAAALQGTQLPEEGRDA